MYPVKLSFMGIKERYIKRRMAKFRYIKVQDEHDMQMISAFSQLIATIHITHKKGNM